MQRQPPLDQAIAVPTRRRGSIRRTSVIDIVYEAGLSGPLTLTGSARDLAKGADGVDRELSRASMELTVGADGIIRSLNLSPAAGGFAALEGTSARAGFRKLLDEADTAAATEGSPLYLLLDEIPVTTMIAGYINACIGEHRASDPRAGGQMIDVCAGWARDAVAARRPERRWEPVAAPTLLRRDDSAAWHPTVHDALARHAMRRRRRIDVWQVADGVAVDAMFRDVFVEDNGTESIVHEYQVTLCVREGRIGSVDVVAGVLPNGECSSAAASALRVDGLTPGELRDYVRREMRGTTTCTHLNDLLRSLADVDWLAQRLV